MNIKFFKLFVEGRKGEILDAALQVFSEKGYDGGSMRDIAQLTGVTEPALYRHYTGKEDLFAQLIIKSGEKLVGEAFLLMDGIKPEDIKNSLENILNDRLKASKTYIPIMKTIFIECIRKPNFMELFKEHLAKAMLKKLSQVIYVIDTHYEYKFNLKGNKKRLRLFMSLFMGYVLTSIIFNENETSYLTETLVKTMGWQSGD